MLKYCLIVSLLFIRCSLLAADTKLTISFPKDIKVENLQLQFNDGGVSRTLHPVFKNNTIVLTEEVKNTYATLLILYPGKNNKFRGVEFCVNSQSAYIQFLKADDDNALSRYRVKNVFIFKGSDEDKALNKYAKKEIAAMIRASEKHDSVANTSTEAELRETWRTEALKCLEYIRSHGDDYWFFWYFCNQLVDILQGTNQLELYEVFNTAFPDKFKNSNEGQNLKKLLIGNIGFKNGDPVPDFSAKDIYGNEVSSFGNKGKYMLISFWATWCVPCVAELPLLKKLRNTYSEKDLEIISISVDRDSMALVKGIAKYQMNWKNIYGVNNLSLLFGNKPVPGLYLVDPAGAMRFTNWIDADNKIIERILAEKLVKNSD